MAIFLVNQQTSARQQGLLVGYILLLQETKQHYMKGGANLLNFTSPQYFPATADCHTDILFLRVLQGIVIVIIWNSLPGEVRKAPTILALHTKAFLHS